MKRVKWVVLGLALLSLFAGGLYVFFAYYSYVFAKTVTGTIIGVERVSELSAVIGNNIPRSQLFSFAVAIKDSHGEIWTSSSEDRQWAVAQKDMCAEAKFYPYPPWNFEKAGTYYGARLIRLLDCPKK